MFLGEFRWPGQFVSPKVTFHGNNIITVKCNLLVMTQQVINLHLLQGQSWELLTNRGDRKDGSAREKKHERISAFNIHWYKIGGT